MAYSKVSGIQGQLLNVTVVGCKGLSDKEWFSRQDPYVFIEYGSTRFRTKTDTDGGKNPSFNEKFMIPLIEGLREINVQVWNSNTVSLDDFIGNAKVLLDKVLTTGYDDTAWPIKSKHGKSAGEVNLILHYANAKSSEKVPGHSVYPASAPGYPPSHVPSAPGYPPSHMPSAPGYPPAPSGYPPVSLSSLPPQHGAAQGYPPQHGGSSHSGYPPVQAYPQPAGYPPAPSFMPPHSTYPAPNAHGYPPAPAGYPPPSGYPGYPPPTGYPPAHGAPPYGAPYAHAPVAYGHSPSTHGGHAVHGGKVHVGSSHGHHKHGKHKKYKGYGKKRKGWKGWKGWKGKK